MNSAHLHLVFNHFPIILPIIGLLMMLSGLIFKSKVLEKAAYGLLILGAIFTFIAFETGEDAEEIIENIPSIEKKYIEAHEEAAEIFTYLSYALGFFSITGFWSVWKKKSWARFVNILVILITLVVLFFAKEVGTTGGEILHTEIRKDFVENLKAR